MGVGVLHGSDHWTLRFDLRIWYIDMHSDRSGDPGIDAVMLGCWLLLGVYHGRHNALHLQPSVTFLPHHLFESIDSFAHAPDYASKRRHALFSGHSDTNRIGI
jgi:hypothetical protein